jgi:hypothetical protein
LFVEHENCLDDDLPDCSRVKSSAENSPLWIGCSPPSIHITFDAIVPMAGKRLLAVDGFGADLILSAIKNAIVGN